MHLLDTDSTIAQLHRADPPTGSAPLQFPQPGQLPAPTMDHLDALEAQSIYIFREADRKSVV